MPRGSSAASEAAERLLSVPFRVLLLSRAGGARLLISVPEGTILDSFLCRRLFLPGAGPFSRLRVTPEILA